MENIHKGQIFSQSESRVDTMPRSMSPAPPATSRHSGNARRSGVVARSHPQNLTQTYGTTSCSHEHFLLSYVFQNVLLRELLYIIIPIFIHVNINSYFLFSYLPFCIKFFCNSFPSK